MFSLIPSKEIALRMCSFLPPVPPSPVSESRALLLAGLVALVPAHADLQRRHHLRQQGDLDAGVPAAAGSEQLGWQTVLRIVQL